MPCFAGHHWLLGDCARLLRRIALAILIGHVTKVYAYFLEGLHCRDTIFPSNSVLKLKESHMRFKFSLLLLLFLAAPICATADTFSDFPLNFGSGFPFEHGEGPCTDLIAPNVCIEALAGATIDATATTPVTDAETFDFTFDIAPDWLISELILFTGTFDYVPVGEFGPNPPALSDWGFEFASKLTLCSADDVCYSSTSTLVQRGGAALPPVSFHAHPGAGTGVYETFLYLDNVEIASNAPPQVNIFLSQVPEPSAFMLIGTSAFGLFGCVRRRLSLP